MKLMAAGPHPPLALTSEAKGPRRLRGAAFAAAFVLALLLLIPRAEAACSATLGAMNFGTIDVLANAPVYTTVDVSVSCSGFGPGETVLVCLGEGWASEGGDNNNGRYLNAGDSYNLTEVTYQDTGHTTIWGAPWDVWSNSVAKQLIVVTDASGNASANFTGYGSIGAGHTTAPPGTYTAHSTDVRVLSHVQSSPSDLCSGINISDYYTATYSFTGTLSATVNAACNISASPLEFGSTGSFITSNIDATATITARCTNTTPYSIGVNDGTNASGSQNRMRLGATANYVDYELYTDSARLNAWAATTLSTSCTSGANSCVLGTGTGSDQSISVYGRVPPQSAPTIGTFTDTVVITVTF
jgi:spore coat protein U-like protein